MSPISRLAAALVLPLALGLAPAASAQEGAINVTASMARILRISAPAATVIIGNPAVADVTIQDPQTLVLTGKSFGRTNMIILDNAGNPIADTIIEVVQSNDNLTVYMGTQRTSMACAPVCQATITLGDDPAFTGMAISSSQQIQGAAAQ